MRAIQYFLTAMLIMSFYSITHAQTDTPDYPSMAAKTVLITGSTDGLGRETATRLGALGAHVLVHGRNR